MDDPKDYLSIDEYETDSDVEIVEIDPKSQIIVLDEDSCPGQPQTLHTNETSAQTNCERISYDNRKTTATEPNVRSRNRPSTADDSYISLQSTVPSKNANFTITSTPKNPFSRYTSSLLSIQNAEPSVLRILTPNTINRRELLSATSIMANEPFFEDKRPGVAHTIPLYNSVYSSESAMAQGGRKIKTPKQRHREITPRNRNKASPIPIQMPLLTYCNVAQSIGSGDSGPPIDNAAASLLGDGQCDKTNNSPRRQRSRLSKSNALDESIVFVSEQLLDEQSVAAIRRSRTERSQKRVSFCFCFSV